MSWDVVQQGLLIGSALAAAGGLLAYLVYRRKERKTIPLGEGWWGAGVKPLSEDPKIYSFKVETSDKEIQVNDQLLKCMLNKPNGVKGNTTYFIILQDLHERIDRTRFSEPLEDSAFHYGFNSTYLKKVVSYWRHEFDWKKQVDVLNKYPHYKTKIEGMHSYFKC